MLVSFSVTNFCSFKEKQTLDMSMITKYHASKDFKNNFFDSKHKHTGKLLKCSAIYGANASGKSNLMKAVYLFNVVSLNLDNDMEKRKRSQTIPFDPFALDDKSNIQPTEFAIDFIVNDKRYLYGFGYDGNKIHYEKLEFFKGSNFQLIYHLQLDKNNILKQKFTKYFEGNKEKSLEIFTNTTNNLFLFLNVNEDGNNFLNPIYDWIANKLYIEEDHQNFTRTARWLYKNPQNKQLVLDLLKKFDLGISDFKIEEKEDDDIRKMLDDKSISNELKNKLNFIKKKYKTSFVSSNGYSLKASQISLGTRAIFSMASSIFPILHDGGVLFYDELDSSLHPDILMQMIKMFHNPKINIGNGQIVFTIHNDILLEKKYKILRRDQVWFVSKSSENLNSYLYSLAEFNSDTATKRDNLVQSYRDNYFGARPIIKTLKINHETAK